MPSSATLLPAAPVVAAVNHLLAHEEWARLALQPHAGKIACIDTSAFQLIIGVAGDGMLQAPQTKRPANPSNPNNPNNEPANGDATSASAQAQSRTADVTIFVKLADLPWIMQNRERAFSSVKVQGDAEFASVLAHLGQNLRWEAEYDLQAIVGEIAARRLVQGGKQVLETAKQGQQKLHENLAEYFLEENPMLVRPQAVEEFGADVAKLRDDVERFEKRLQSLARDLAAS